MYIDTIVPAGIVSFAVMIIGNIWRRGKEEGRIAEREEAIDKVVEKIQGDISTMAADARAEREEWRNTLQGYGLALAKMEGVLIGVDGRNGMRKDMGEMRDEIARLREKTVAIELVQVSARKVGR